MLRVRNDGVPIVGFTWYSLTDQVDWDTALREPNGHIDPVGLLDLDRNIRPVGEAYRELISDWGAVLPTQSIVLSLPITPRQPEVIPVGDAGALEHPPTATRPQVVQPDTPGSSSPPTPATTTSAASVTGAILPVQGDPVK